VVPSIVMGIFAYTVVVLPMRHFSALAGGLALASLLIPIAVRSTEEFLKLVPMSIRESALALGVPAVEGNLTSGHSHRDAGALNGRLIGSVAGVGRDGAALVYGVRKSILERGLDEPHLPPCGDDLYVCRIALRRLAPPGVGRGAGPFDDGIVDECGCTGSDAKTGEAGLTGELLGRFLWRSW